MISTESSKKKAPREKVRTLFVKFFNFSPEVMFLAARTINSAVPVDFSVVSQLLY